MFGRRKTTEEALRARIAALESIIEAQGLQGPQEAAGAPQGPQAARYWAEDGRRIYTTPGGEVWTLGERILGGLHCLIAGTTGCGKSTLINDVMYSAMNRTPASLTLYLCDPKKVELSRYAGLPHVARYADTHEDIVRTVEEVAALMDRRFDEMKARGLRTYDGGRVLLIIDEIADLRIGPHSKAFTATLQRVLALGRAARVSVLAATQSPSRLIIPATLVVNFPVRVGLKCASAIESRQITGAAGCEALPRHGLGIMVDGIDVDRVRVPLTPDGDIDARIAFWAEQDAAAAACITPAARKRPENQADTLARARIA